MAIPSGVIIAWPSTVGSIPAGWSRVTSLDGRFVKQIASSVTAPGATGGASTHTHPFNVHSHTYAAHTHSGSWGESGNASSSGTAATLSPNATSPLTHPSSGGSGTPSGSNTATTNTGSENLDPQHVTVIFIQSDGSPAGIPVTGVVWFNATTPSGFAAYSNLDNRLMKGAGTGANGGTQAGSSSHTHTTPHTHPISDHTHTVGLDVAPNVNSPNTLGSGSNIPVSHTHTLGASTANSGQSTSDSTDDVNGTADLTPPWQKMRAVQKTGSEGVVLDVICMWLGSLGSIPTGWALCDGTAGTPNLSQGKYVRAAAADGEIGDLGGAATHTHSAASAHSHTSTGTHTHTFTGVSSSDGPTPVNCGTGGATFSTNAHTHASTTYTSPAETSGTSNTANTSESANSSNDPVFTGVAYIQLKIQTFEVALEATAGAVAAIRRDIAKGIEAVASSVASVFKGLAHSLAATSAGAAVLVTSRLFMATLSATAVGIASFGSKVIGKVLSAPAAGVATFVRRIAKGLSAPAGSAATILRTRLLTMLASSPVLVSVTRAVTRFLQAQVIALFSHVVIGARAHRFITNVTRAISIRLVGPQEVVFKAGTLIEFESTFTDADGELYDPDAGTAKVFLRKPDGNYLTGFVPDVSGGVMSQLSSGVYRYAWQTERSYDTGIWTVEVEGMSGVDTSIDDFKIQLKA